MDEYIDSYIYTLLSSDDISKDEFVESVSTLISEDLANELYHNKNGICGEGNRLPDMLPVIASARHHKDVVMKEQSDEVPVDTHIKKYILSRYDLRRVDQTPVVIDTNAMFQYPTKKERYRDGMIVSRKGEKYV